MRCNLFDALHSAHGTPNYLFAENAVLDFNPLNVALAVTITQRGTILGGIGLSFVLFWCGTIFLFCAAQLFNGDDKNKNH